MKINAFEKLMVNNPIRYALMRRTFAYFARVRPAGAAASDVLEVGCGFGVGLRFIDQFCRPTSISAFDLDERMVEAARRRAGGVSARTEVSTGDAENMAYPNDSFDAVFELTIFHHIPDWRRAVAEVARVLRPGGLFFYEELVREFHFDLPVISWVQQRFTVHPWDSIPARQTFLDAIAAEGLQHVDIAPDWLKGWLRGVARKPI